MHLTLNLVFFHPPAPPLRSPPYGFPARHGQYPLAGSQLRAEVAPSSCNNVAVDSIISSTINSTIGMAMHTNISDQDQNEKSSVYSNIRQSSGSSSCRNSKEGCNRTVVLVAHPSIDHHIVHDIDGGGGGGGGDGGGGGNRSDHTSLNFPTPSSKIGTVDLHDNNEVEPVGRSPSSPVASDLEKGVLVLGNPLQSLGGDEDASTHSDQYGDTLPSVPFPLSSSGGSEDDELSSVDYDVDEEGEEGGGEEAEGELDAAVDRVFVLFEQGQEALEKTLVDRAEQVRDCIDCCTWWPLACKQMCELFRSCVVRFSLFRVLFLDLNRWIISSISLHPQLAPALDVVPHAYFS